MRIIHAANLSPFIKNSLHSWNFAQHYYMDRAISKGLTRQEHDVFDFAVEEASRRYQTWWCSKKRTLTFVNTLLSETVHRLCPEWLLLGHAPHVSPDILATLRQQYPGMKIAQWWIDSLHIERVKNIQRLQQKLPYLDAFFCTTAVDYLQHSLIDISKIYFMPNMLDSSVHVGQAFMSTNYKHDVVFIGQPNKMRLLLTEKMKTMFSSFNVGLYGDHHNKISSMNYVNTLSHTKIAINFSHDNNIPLYSSDRIVHIAGNGAMVLSPRVPRMEMLFAEDEVAYFNDLDDMCEKLYYYLTHDDDRRTIAQKGWERAHRSYNEKRVTKFLEEICFSRTMTDSYEWWDNDKTVS